MAITRVKTSSILQNFPKERSMLAGNDGDTGAYESIATVTVGAGGASDIVFDNIPGTFQHLQIRGIGRSNRAATNDPLLIYFNTDTSGTTNYTLHNLTGNGSSANTYGAAPEFPQVDQGLTGTSTASAIFASSVTDILDYANTNKYKTRRSLAGIDANGSGTAELSSSLWLSTSAITKITLKPRIGTLISQYSHFALYGIR